MSNFTTNESARRRIIANAVRFSIPGRECLAGPFEVLFWPPPPAGLEMSNSMVFSRTPLRSLIILSLVLFCAAFGRSPNDGPAFAQQGSTSGYDEQITAGRDFMRQRK